MRTPKKTKPEQASARIDALQQDLLLGESESKAEGHAEVEVEFIGET